MALSRTWYNTLVDDDGSNTTGTLWNKAAVDSLLDAVDDVLDGIDDQGALSPAAATELTIATGAVTLTAGKNIYTIDTEANAATDDLDTISLDAGGREGRVIILKPELASSRVPTIRHNVGNIQLKGGSFVMNDANDLILLVRIGSSWHEVSRSGATTGTFTPSMSASGGGSPTWTTQTGRYVKRGNWVICHMTMTLTSETFSGNLSLTGLPFTAAASDAGGGEALLWSSLSTTQIRIRALVDDGATTAALYALTAATANGNTRLTNTDVGNGSSFEFTLSYITAS